MALRDDILGMDDRKGKTIKIPEWNNKSILVRPLSPRQRTALFEGASKNKSGEPDGIQIMLRTVVISACDPKTSKPIFSMEDMEALQDKNSTVMDRIADLAFELSGMGEKALKEAEKNS